MASFFSQQWFTLFEVGSYGIACRYSRRIAAPISDPCVDVRDAEGVSYPILAGVLSAWSRRLRIPDHSCIRRRRA